MSTHPHKLLDLRKIRQQVEAATSIRSGFPTDQDYSRFSHIVELHGLCRDRLGHERFCIAFHAARNEAVRLAPAEFLIEPIRDARRVVAGYEFSFADEHIAVTFQNAAAAAMARKGVV